MWNWNTWKPHFLCKSFKFYLQFLFRFFSIQRKLRDEARKEFEEDKAELFRQINMERSAAQRELEALRSKLKLGNVCETTNVGVFEKEF